MEKRYMTCQEFAVKHDVPYQTVVRWARRRLIPGVKVMEVGRIKLYAIPDDAKPLELKTGRPKKAGAKKSVKKGTAKWTMPILSLALDVGNIIHSSLDTVWSVVFRCGSRQYIHRNNNPSQFTDTIREQPGLVR
jgi:hypothetical protein